MPLLLQIVIYAACGLLITTIARYAWEASSSPLSKFPGPPLAKLTDARRAIATARGDIDATHRALHRKYGTAVRIGPDCISISDPNLIRTIYATKNPWIKSDMYRANDVVVDGQRISNVFNTQDENWHTKYMRPTRGFWSIPEDGFTLPDGRYSPGATKIGINPAFTCRDFEVFGDDVEKFNPDRWLQKDGESKEDYEVRVKHMREINDFVFGAGGRVCMGRSLATLETWKLFGTLYSKFDMKLKDSTHQWKNHNAGFVYQYNVPCILSRREEQKSAKLNYSHCC